MVSLSETIGPCNNNNHIYCTSVIYYWPDYSHQNNNKLRRSVDKSSVYNSGERGALYDRPLLPIKIPIVGVVLDGRQEKHVATPPTAGRGGRGMVLLV